MTSELDENFWDQLARIAGVEADNVDRPWVAKLIADLRSLRECNRVLKGEVVEALKPASIRGRPRKTRPLPPRALSAIRDNLPEGTHNLDPGWEKALSAHGLLTSRRATPSEIEMARAAAAKAISCEPKSSRADWPLYFALIIICDGWPHRFRGTIFTAMPFTTIDKTPPFVRVVELILAKAGYSRNTESIVSAIFKIQAQTKRREAGPAL